MRRRLMAEEGEMKEYRKIAHVILDEEIKEIKIEADLDGRPFAITEIIANAYIKSQAEPTNSSDRPIESYIKLTDGKWYSLGYWGKITTTANAHVFVHAEANIQTGKSFVAESGVSIPIYEYNPISKAPVIYYGPQQLECMGPKKITGDEKITSIRMYPMGNIGAFGVGTEVIIYGR